MFERIFLGLGSNVGDRLSYLKKAQESLECEGVVVNRSSSIYETAPIGLEYQGDFLNQVLEVQTYHSPLELLRIMLDIEKRQGPRSRLRWGPRRLDMDLLIYGSRRVRSDELLLPHPEIENRRFVLEPLHELDSTLVLKGRAIWAWVSELQDQRVVWFSKGFSKKGSKEYSEEHSEEQEKGCTKFREHVSVL